MRRVFSLLAIPCMLAILLLMPGKANAQASWEIEGHASFALEELSRLADGTGAGVLVAVTYPVYYEDRLKLIGKVGFNHYGTKSGNVEVQASVFPVDSAYRGIPINAGVRLYYGQERKFYTEGLLGLEVKQGDLEIDENMDEITAIDPVLSIGGGYAISSRLSLIASFGMSNDLWRYANLGIAIRFGG